MSRAAQKLNIKSHKKKKHHEEKEERPQFPTNFSDVIRMNPPPAPPALVRSSGRLQNPSTGKVKVMLRICPVESSHSETFLGIDQWKKQVTLYDPAQSGYTTAAHRKPGVTPPKMFAFDAIFSQDDSMPEICANSLVDIIQAVVNGADGCLFCYGHARLGKTYTMIGVDDSPQNLGILPCSIAWLFKLINDQKDQTGARFSVRVSAVEVTGKQEQLKDLLADVASGNESGGNTAPGVYLREDPICGTQLENQSELRAPTAERAAYYLDAAIAARTIPEAEEDARNSHLLFTLHVYQYRVEKNSKGQATGKEQQVAGGRSRLHLIDLGSCSKSTKDGNALSLSALGTVIMALLNGQRHVPHRDSKLTQLMRESLGSLSCRTCMIAHVSPSMQAYNETLQVTQLAAKIHRMKRRKTKFSSTSSDDSSSCSESGPFRPRMRVGVRMGTYGAYSDPDYTSSSEQSCDTVIYVGPGGQALSDRELTDNEGPPSVVPIVPRTRSLPRPNKLASQEYQYPLSEEGEMGGEIPVKQPKTMPKCGATTVASSRQTSKSGSPSRQLQAQQGQPAGAVGGSGIVQLPRKINVSKTKVLQHARMNMEQQDSYNPGWSYREGPAGEAAPGGEQWVDGPGAPQTSAPHEQWIDGPNIAPVQQSWSNESYVYNGEGKPIPLSSVSSSGLVKPSAGEQWVDGPREFQGEEIRRSHGSPHKMTKAEKAHKMWKQMSGKPLPPQRVSSLENWTPQYKSQVPHRDDREHYREQSRERHRDRRPRDLEQPKSGQLRNPHVHHLSTNESRPSSHCSGGESASSSMVAQTSRPSVDMETDQSHKDVGPKGDGSLPNAPVKSFVRDWVQKHSVGPTGSPEQSQHGSPSKHTSSRHHKSKEVKNPTISDMLYEKENTSGGSAHSSPRSSRKHHHKLKKTALPPSDSTQSRITQWVQQVQEATSTSTEAPFSPNSEAPISEELLAPECDQAMLFDSKSPAPPPYEACVGSDTGIDDLDEDIPDVEQQYLDAEKARLKSQTSTEVIKDSRDSDHKPLLITEAEDKEAFNKGLDEVEKSSTISKSSDAKILKEKESNSEVTKEPDEAERHQDSLYEMDIDTQFEEIEKDSKLNSTFTSEDDAGSNAASLPKKDIDKVLADSPLTVDVHQQALQVSRTSDEGVVEETCETNDQVTAELIVHAQLSPLSVNADVDSGNASAHSGEHLSPPSSSDDSDKVTTRGRSLCRPSCLRRPDGASNPNLSIMEQTLKEKAETVGQEKDAVVGSPSSVLPKPLYSSTPSTTSKVCHVTAGEISPIPKRSVLGHSPEDSSRGEQAESPTKLSKLPLKSPSKDTKVQIKDSKEKSNSKPSILPKPLSRKSKSADRAESTSSSPSKLIPSRFSSKSSTSSKSSKSSAGSASPTKSSSSSRKSEKHSGKHAKSSSPSPSSRPSSVKSAPSRFSSPFFSRLPTSSPSKSSKTQVTSPSKSSTSSSNGGKESRSKIKSPSSSKKESKLPVSKTATSPTGKVPGLPPPRPSGRGTDSDSGNDSGIVKNDKSKRLLSPYSTVTNPRVSTHSSSGHGSDFSTSSAQQVLEKNTKLLRQKEAHLSSGYESMVGQDGEATGTSSGTQDSTSESSAGGRIHGNKVLKKKPPSCAGLKSRSRSAPPPKVDSPASVHKDSPVQSPSRNPASPSPRHAWVDTRHAGYDATDETMEIQFYDVDDVERIHKRRKEAAEMQVTEKRKERIQQLLQRQEELKMELAEAKGRLMINKSTWSFDLHVAEQTNWEDPSHLEALEKETSILEKRVDACKARIMMVTCFDANLA